MVPLNYSIPGLILRIQAPSHTHLPCVAALVIAIMAKYYDVPMISWAATSTELANPKRFPTMARTIGSAIRMGRAIKEVLQFFNWRRIAMLYTDDGTTRKCFSIAEGVRKILPSTDIINVHNLAIDRATILDEEIDRFLDILEGTARSKPDNPGLIKNISSGLFFSCGPVYRIRTRHAPFHAPRSSTRHDFERLRLDHAGLRSRQQS